MIIYWEALLEMTPEHLSSAIHKAFSIYIYRMWEHSQALSFELVRTWHFVKHEAVQRTGLFDSTRWAAADSTLEAKYLQKKAFPTDANAKSSAPKRTCRAWNQIGNSRFEHYRHARQCEICGAGHPLLRHENGGMVKYGNGAGPIPVRH